MITYLLRLLHNLKLTKAFVDTQQAIANDDLDTLTAQFTESAEKQADDLMATLPKGCPYCGKPWADHYCPDWVESFFLVPFTSTSTGNVSTWTLGGTNSSNVTYKWF
jgi:hypothetical protein